MTTAPLLTSQQLLQRVPMTSAAQQTVATSRAAIENILVGKDRRLMVIAGPCSIHDPESALEFGERLRALSLELQDELLILMRTYLEKPRTVLGWRGFMTDPHLNGSFDIESGAQTARKLLTRLNELGLGCATESLDPMLVGYTEDLVAWTALGARTSESQVHRAMASGLAMPVGFKNGTHGDVEIAVDALQTARNGQTYIRLDRSGQAVTHRSDGNQFGHVVLRGGRNGPNFDESHVAACEQKLRARQLPENIVIDCSHANSDKQHARQLDVLINVGQQIVAGNQSIVGVMLESHLHDGNQPLQAAADLNYGVSVTDACLGWDATAQALRRLSTTVASVRAGQRQLTEGLKTSTLPATRQVA